MAVEPRLVELERGVAASLRKHVREEEESLRRHIKKQTDCSGLLERIQYLVSGNIQELTLLAPLGADVSAHAHVPSVSRVWVDVGLDVFLEFSLSEAVAFLTAKLDRLTSEVKASLERLSAVRARLEKLQTDGILFRQ